MTTPDVQIRIEFQVTGDSGSVKVWNTYEADSNRDPSSTSVKAGGKRLYTDTYSLDELNYDSTSGALTLYMESAQVFSGHAKHKGVKDNGKPDDRIKAEMILCGDNIGGEEVKYMVVAPNMFYTNLHAREELRAAMGADLVYGPSDGQPVTLKQLGADDLGPDGLDLPQNIIDLIGEPASVPGFKSALYREYVTGKYILAIAGTDDVNDWIENALQGLGQGSLQYTSAMQLADGVHENLGGNMIITGHSLGGGLASAGSVATGIHAYTFNAAGLRRETVQELDGIFAGSLNNYDNNAAALVTAYYLDWDILSYAQDHSGDLMQSAIGTRMPMDGPVDTEVAGYAAISFVPVPGSWLVSLGGAAGTMGFAHTTKYYLYGLMVLEASTVSGLDGAIIWDIQGEPL